MIIIGVLGVFFLNCCKVLNFVMFSRLRLSSMMFGEYFYSFFNFFDREFDVNKVCL